MDEGLLPLVDALREAGIRASVWTALRWTRSGVRGSPRLESVKIGGRHHTSVPAVRRWIAAQNDEPSTPATNDEPRAGSERASRQSDVDYLERAGLGRENVHDERDVQS